MLVYLGKYKNWVGPYQIAKAICFWAPKTKDEFGREEFPDWVDKFGDYLAKTPLNGICEWVEKKRKRTKYIRIDYYDTWSMDHTLAPVILQMLKQLKDTKHGAPNVDDIDVPEHLRLKNDDAEENGSEYDELLFQRWDWILDEMIWAFGEYVTDWEDQFHSGVIDFEFKTDENGRNLLVEGPNHTSKHDHVGYMAHYNRIRNGMSLFGKYYMSLWD